MSEDVPAVPVREVPPAGRRSRRLMAVSLTLAGVVVVADQATKQLAQAHLVEGRSQPLVGDLLRLTLYYNPGAAFGIAGTLTPLLALIAVAVAVAVVRAARRLGSVGWTVGLGLLLGGAVGNLVDRLVREPGFGRGHVVDFLDLPNLFVFNLADAAITSAAVIIAVLGLRGIGPDGVRTTRAEQAAAEQTSPEQTTPEQTSPEQTTPEETPRDA